MSTEQKFKIMNEIKLSQAGQFYEPPSDSKQEKMVFCHFSGIKEQTQNEATKPEKSLRIYSRGGSEFVVPFDFRVLDVYPIENGLIIKTEYNKDLIIFDPIAIRSEASDKQPLFAYMTLTEHPLNDIHPLSFNQMNQMIETGVDIIHVSYKIPLLVLFDYQTHQLQFGLLKKKLELDNIDMIDEGESYIRSIEPESRHPEMFNLSKDYQIYIDPIFTINNIYNQPKTVLLSKGLVSPYELIIQLYFQQEKRLDFYSCDIKNPKLLNLKQSLQNIQDATQIIFSRQKYDQNDSIKIISKGLALQLQSKSEDDPLDLQYFKKRVKNLVKDTIITDTQGKQILIFQGYTQVFNIDLYQFIESQLSIEDRNMITKNSKIDRFFNPMKSNLSIAFNNGYQKRFTLKFIISDFLVKSIMKTFKTILPQNVYETLTQDLIELMSRPQIDSKSDQQDQFQKFQNMLIQIVSGEVYQVQSKITQPIVQSNIAPAQSQAQVIQPKPIQTIQTKILRSSTTSFGSDTIMTRRKTQNQAQIQQQQQVAQQQMRQAQPQRSSIGSINAIAQNIQRRVTSGSIETQQPVGLQTSSVSFAQQSQNAFAELLNSDFHKQNFKQSFGSLFPADFNIVLPVIQKFEAQSAQITQVSPSKQSQQTKIPSTQKISSTNQSNVLSQTSQPHHERKNSTSEVKQNQPLTISLSLSLNSQYPLKTQKAAIEPYLPNIIQCLHLMYEDIKINKLIQPIENCKLATLLIRLCLLFNPGQKSSFIDYYLQENPSIKDDLKEEVKKVFFKINPIKDGIEIEQVPQIYKWIQGQLRKPQSSYMKFPLFFEQTRKLVRLYEILSGSSQNSNLHPLLTSSQIPKPINNDVGLETLIFKQQSQQEQIITKQDYLMCERFKDLHPFEKILFCLKEESINLDEIKKMPSVIALPIIEIIRYARLYQQEIQTATVWPDSLYRLIQREDILNNNKMFERNALTKSSSTNLPNLNDQFQKQTSKKFALNRGLTNVFLGSSAEEMKQQEHRKEMETNIMKTAADLIQTQPDIVQGSHTFDAKDPNNRIEDFFKNRFSHDTRLKEAQNMLNSASEILIKMEHIHNRESLSEEQLNVEKQKLLDKMFLRHLAKCAGRGALSFGTRQTIPTEMLNIPKINQTGFVPMTENYMQLEFKDDAASKEMLQWPEFHNGVASALRIALSFRRDTNQKGSGVSQSHTRNWIMFHKPQEPKYEHGGFLLAIGLLGQLDTLQPTDIYQHLKTTHDATAIGMLLGRAASKIGTMDDHDTRTLCIHIPYLLPPSMSIEISLSIQSAAVVGAGLLYKGTSNRLMTEMLLAQIGRKPLSDKAIEREGYALASGIALGLVNLGVGNKMQGLSDLKLDERLIRYVEGGKIIDLPQSMLSQNFNHDNTKQGGCSSIKEGDMVNVHITSQGALVALALIHLKSNNQQIAQQLAMPQTFYSLESVRPQFLLLKTLCRNLIMWDGIQCSKDWIQSQIPTIIKEIYESDIKTVEKKYQSKSFVEDGIDYSTVALCYVNIIAGALFSIGFKYVGTGNKDAFHLIMDYCLNFFRKLKVMQSNKDCVGVVHSNFTKNQIDKNTLETCLCVCAFSMSMIMAGTGDIECFRAIRILRKRFEHEMHYGYNMAINMSLGFLFLGTGAFTFSRSDLAIASLLCSLYPMFPSSPNDNRYHLQALRHFYVLAIETRLLQARDIDNGQFLSLDANVTIEETNLKGEIQTKTVQFQTPDIINGKIKNIELQSDQYHNVRIDMDNEDNQEQNNILSGKRQKDFDQFGFQKIIYVKKKASALIEDNNSQQIMNNQPSLQQSQAKLITESLENLDPNSRSLIEDGSKIFEKVLQIKDPTIEAFNKIFSNIEELQNGVSLNSSEIEDVLLAQNRDPFRQLSPQEFFKIQDTFDVYKERFDFSILPMSIQQKLVTLRAVHDSYYQDKLELFRAMIEQIYNKQGINRQNDKILKDYSQFRSNLAMLTDKENVKNLSLNLETNQNKQLIQVDIEQQRQHIYNLVNNFSGYFSENKQSNLMIDMFQIQIGKFVIDQVLNELTNQGEGEIVQRYRQLKGQGQPFNDGPLIEINETIKMTLQQIFEENCLENDIHNIDQVLIPAIVRQ